VDAAPTLIRYGRVLRESAGSTLPLVDAARYRVVTAELAHEAADGLDVLVATLELLDRAVGADTLSTTPVQRPGGSVPLPVLRGTPPLSEWELGLWPRLIGTHPYYVRLRAGPDETSRMTDVLTLRDLDRLPVYQLLMRPRASRYHASLVLERTGRTLLVASLFRWHHDFSERELDVLEQVRRPLAAALAYRAALTLLEEPLGLVPAAPRGGALTPRERQVAALVARGLTNEQIGTRLALSPRTVRKHVEDACRRTGSTGRAGLAAWWARSTAGGRRRPAPLAPE
jgi:DNA-binding CsgD family transcriptional regulator